VNAKTGRVTERALSKAFCCSTVRRQNSFTRLQRERRASPTARRHWDCSEQQRTPRCTLPSFRMLIVCTKWDSTQLRLKLNVQIHANTRIVSPTARAGCHWGRRCGQVGMHANFFLRPESWKLY
jgi:hypothetical protein